MNHHLILLLVFLSLESVSLNVRPSHFPQLETKKQNSCACRAQIVHSWLWPFVTVAGLFGVHLPTVANRTLDLYSSLLAAGIAYSGG